MKHALYLLNHQPTAWPKWQHGRDAHNLPTAEQHLFLFEPEEFGLGLGRAVPACQFVDGATWVGSRLAGPMAEPTLVRLCYDCMEVSLQHKLLPSDS